MSFRDSVGCDFTNEETFAVKASILMGDEGVVRVLNVSKIGSK